ncbi:phospholipase DDHD1-like isoform X2 [Ctenocephalides felis]|uniref:phospholipase DDHD1-like isoform X2 n=1 Tax=Ctenocephalides felis TaxID=7515 RepID=UPI000E6E21F7|nr:phospholipase DDHD1-like isoform X2 [Ctenocephalides felis]
MNYQKLFSKFNYVYTDTVEENYYEDIITQTDDQNNKTVKDDKTYTNYEITQTTFNSENSELLIIKDCAEVLDKELEIKQEIPVRELSPEDVRWFYKAVQDKVWLEFSGYDSLRIESKYRKIYKENILNHDCGGDNKSDLITKPPIANEKTDASAPNTETTKHLSNGVVRHQEEDQKISLDIITDNNILSSTINSFKNTEPHDATRSENRKRSSADKDESTTEDFSKEHVFDPEQRIVVRGGMYEVDLHFMTCESIYWPGEQCLITRGIYFYDATWQPLEMGVSLEMEEHHQKLFNGKLPSECTPDGSSKGNPIVIHTAHFTDFHIAWLSPDEIYLYSENAPSKIVRSVTHRLGFQKSTGYRIKRGYRVPATESDQPQSVTHLVFVIHGIGQKMDAGKIIRNTAAFRESVDWLKNKYFPSANQRAEFFPVEWRSSLKLDSDMVDAITPYNVMSIRHLLNCSAMDIMYYTSPLYGMEVQRGLIEELNRLHAMFLLRNPTFRGSVSVLAHSLGSVILYDVITGYQPGVCQRNCGSSVSSKEPTPVSPLSFTIEQLFCLGSPLSVFIALRLSEPSRKEVLPPGLCTGGFYNIFHLSDPVAYRMEPLLCRDYRNIAPLMIQPYTLAVAGDVRYGEMPLEMINRGENNTSNSSPKEAAQKESQPTGAGGSWRIWSYVRPPWNKSETQTATCTGNETNACNSASPESQQTMSCENQPDPDAGANATDVRCDKEIQENAQNHSNAHCLPNVDPSIKLTNRVDYAIRETGLAMNYWSAITSHTSYWTNYDVAYFVLSRLFPDLEHQAERNNTGNNDMFDSLPV